MSSKTKIALITLFLGTFSINSNALDLKVATYNLGYLEFKVDLFPAVKFDDFVPAEVPDYQQRLENLDIELSSYLESEKPDIIAFQEIWNVDAQIEVGRLAVKNGYFAVSSFDTSKYQQSQHGLEIYVKEGIPFSSVKFRPYLDSNFKNIRAFITGVAPGVYRGALSVVVKVDGKAVEVFNSHFTPIASNHGVRQDQADSLAYEINQSKADIQIVAADLNFSPQFSFSIEDREKDGTDEEWSANAQIYGRFLGQTEMIDTFLEHNPEDDNAFTQDRLRNDLANYSLSTTEEPEQRIDYVFAKFDEGCEVTSSELFFTDPVKAEDGSVVMSDSQPDARLFLSDHFGVQSTISCE